MIQELVCKEVNEIVKKATPFVSKKWHTLDLHCYLEEGQNLVGSFFDL